METKKQKRRGVYLKNSKQKEGLEKYAPKDGRGLKLQWLNFISVYIKNGGNATEAYLAAYPEASRETARRNGSRLLTHADIIEEIKSRYDQQTVTDSWIIATAKKFVVAGLENPKLAFSGVKALEMIARSKGLLNDVHKEYFTSENPAIFPALVRPETVRKMEEQIRKGIRISE